MMSDEQATAQLVAHHYFQAHVTPLQIFNRATDPFLPGVKDHLFAVLNDLDARGLTNHTLVVTRCAVNTEDCANLAALKHLKLTLLFTYSGIEDASIEPFPSVVALEAMKTASDFAPRRYRTVFYWRPLVSGLNDSPDHLERAAKFSRLADAAVFTGLFYRDQIAKYYKMMGLREPYGITARRKILPETLESRVLEAFARFHGAPLFRKTSCAVSSAHGLPDYNGHYGIRELCNICPIGQQTICGRAHKVPTRGELEQVRLSTRHMSGLRVLELTNRAAVVEGLPDEQPRYFLQHRFAFQVHDVAHPHEFMRHGRAEIGWSNAND